MKKTILFSFAIFLFSLMGFSQSGDPIVFKINGMPVYKSELEEAYHKSKKLKDEPLADYLPAYINFRLNIKEAKAQNLDTVTNYRRDLSIARGQLALKYIEEETFPEMYANKIYQRMLENAEVNHVLIPFEKEINLPSDTVELYKKALKVREDIIERGFKDYNYSGTAVVMDAEKRNGYLGWVVPFMLSAKVEDAVYSLPLKEISQPIRTSKGYHIVQVLNKRPAVGGADVEQVVFNFPQVPPAIYQIDSVRQVVNNVYGTLRSAEDFDLLCAEFSRVYNTGDKGCNFGIVKLDSHLPPNFINGVFDLKNKGDISRPILTDYGFHIARLKNKLQEPSYDVVKVELKRKIEGSDKMETLIKEKRRKLIKEFNQTYNKEAYAKLQDIAKTISPQSPDFLKQINNQDEVIFTINNTRTFYVKDFANYIAFRQKQLESNTEDLEMIRVMDIVRYSLSTDLLDNYFQAFLYARLSDFSYETLEDRYPEFKKTMNNFSNDLLSYIVKNENIWLKSKTDSVGLAEFFKENKEKYKLDGKMYKGVIVYAKDKNTIKEVEYIASRFQHNNEFISEVKKRFNKDSVRVQFESGLWAKNDNAVIDHKIFDIGDAPVARKGYPFFFVKGNFITAPEEYTDVKALVENDYQDFLEKKWENYLKNKYTVEIDQSVLKTIE